MGAYETRWQWQAERMARKLEKQRNDWLLIQTWDDKKTHIKPSPANFFRFLRNKSCILSENAYDERVTRNTDYKN